MAASRRKATSAETDTQDGVVNVPQQSDEARQAILEKSSAAPISAVGSARDFALGQQEERIKNLDSRGSTVPIAGGDGLKADYAEFTPGAPVGAQAQPMNFTTNGGLGATLVGSPSGPQPVSAFTSDPAEAQKRLEETLKSHDDFFLTRGGFKKLSRAQVEQMSPADLRAVASDRGYDIGDNAGSRLTRKRFLSEQAKDSDLKDAEETEPSGDNETDKSGE